jgi:transcriptional regulator
MCRAVLVVAVAAMQYTIDEIMEMLTESDLMTHNQAQVYALREFKNLPNKYIAKGMQNSPSTISEQYQIACKKVESARTLVETLQELRGENPSTCTFCDQALTGRFTTAVRDGTRVYACGDCLEVELTEHGQKHVQEANPEKNDSHAQADDDDREIPDLTEEDIENALEDYPVDDSHLYRTDEDGNKIFDPSLIDEKDKEDE